MRSLLSKFTIAGNLENIGEAITYNISHPPCYVNGVNHVYCSKYACILLTFSFGGRENPDLAGEKLDRIDPVKLDLWKES